MKTRVTLAFVLGVLLLGVLGGFYRTGFIQLNNPSVLTYPVRGVDVSHHQGAIDWQRLIVDSGIDFAFIKASEGATLRDPRFDNNWEGSKSIARGPYHFFTFCTDGNEQAKNFLAVIPEANELPPAIDIEFEGTVTPGHRSRQFAES